MDNLVKRLNSERISIPELANELNLKNDQVELIIDNLIDTGRVKGTYTSDYAFVSDNAIKNLIVDLVERTGKIDFHEIVRELSIPEDKVRDALEEISRTIIKALAPYNRVKIADLSQEVNLPINVTSLLLKDLISKGKIDGSIDMVSQTLLIDRTVAPIKSELKREILKEPERRTKPSAAWYLVPLLLGLLGGIIGYFAVKDQNRDMANSLLNVGIIMTFIDIIFIWGLYSWYISKIVGSIY